MTDEKRTKGNFLSQRQRTRGRFYCLNNHLTITGQQNRPLVFLDIAIASLENSNDLFGILTQLGVIN